MWRGSTEEYLKALRERHRLKHSGKPSVIAVGDVTLIKEVERNLGELKMGIVDKLIIDWDGVVRAANLQDGKSYLERARQQLHSLEMTCDREMRRSENELNSDAVERTTWPAAQEATHCCCSCRQES